MKKDITNIFFDVGSVLLKRKDDLWAMAAECLGVTRDEYSKIVTAIHEDHQLTQQLWREANTLEKEREFYSEFTREIQRRLGLEVDETKTKYLTDVFAKRSYRLALGSHEILAWLKKQGYILGVISNAPVSRRHYEMKEHELEQYFDVVVLSRDISVDKPHPDIFRHALKLAEAAANQSAMVDDKIENLLAAKNLGFMVLVLFGEETPNLPTGLRQISRLEELRKIF